MLCFRGLLFNCVYFVTFYFLFLGLFSLLLRLFMSLVLGVIYLGRLDKTIMVKNFEVFDLGVCMPSMAVWESLWPKCKSTLQMFTFMCKSNLKNVYFYVNSPLVYFILVSEIMADRGILPSLSLIPVRCI